MCVCTNNIIWSITQLIKSLAGFSFKLHVSRQRTKIFGQFCSIFLEQIAAWKCATEKNSVQKQKTKTNWEQKIAHLFRAIFSLLLEHYQLYDEQFKFIFTRTITTTTTSIRQQQQQQRTLHLICSCCLKSWTIPRKYHNNK